MTRRGCQSCRHYKAAGFDNMGWCNHPKRRTGDDVRILVRAHELPCRNDWASDLWQPADHSDTDVVIDGGARPVAPASPDELSFLAAQANRPKPEVVAADAAARGEDVVVGEVTASIAAGEMSHPDQNRMTLRRAHEAVRSRMREQRNIVAPTVDSGGPPPIDETPAWPALEQNGWQRANAGETQVANREAPSGNEIIGEVSPVALGEMGRPFPKLTMFPEDDARFSSIPKPVEGFELPIATRREAPRVIGRAGFDDDHSATEWVAESEPIAVIDAADDLPEIDEIPVIDVVQESVAVRQPRRRLLGRVRQRPGREPAPLLDDDLLTDFYAEPELPAYVDEHDQPAREPHPGAPNVASEDAHLIASAEMGRGSAYDRPVKPAVRPERRDRSDALRRRGFDAPDLHERTSAPVHAVDNQWYDAPEPVESDSHLLDGVLDEMGIDLPVEDYVISPGTVDEEIRAAEPPHWSEIPRMCRTCRDFRPAEHGARGWCTNKWAFSHRRMVDADELPCETSIGGWWLPHDESWMSVVDVSAHSQPTPLLDQWLAHRAVTSGEYDATPPLRRRQRS